MDTLDRRDLEVFPTHVGVFPRWGFSADTTYSLPHARGGVSKTQILSKAVSVSSPRTWGCFHGISTWRLHSGVFPTHVGVFLNGRTPSSSGICLPHARGGVSEHGTKTFLNGSSSPRTWGCFPIGIRLDLIKGVFPTHVGVFPLLWHRRRREEGLPHARGGVSGGKGITQDAIASSPRTWGCFPAERHARPAELVFPTHVGVFLRRHSMPYKHGSLPHARGGVSRRTGCLDSAEGSSPRTWGCFRLGA